MSISLSTSAGVVTLKENYDGYAAGVGLDGPYVLKQYLAPSWSVAFACVNALQGSASVTGGAGGLVIYKVGHQCPESPNLYCLEARIEPKAENDSKDAGRPTFNLPLINCRYALPPYNQQTSDDPGGLNSFTNDGTPGNPYVFMTESIDFDTETIRVPGSTYSFVTAPNLPVDYPVAKHISTAKFVIVRKFLPYLPTVNVTTYIKKLNDRVFLGQPVGQIQLLNARTRVERLSDGTKSQEFEMVFKWREYDHNKIMRPDDGTFDFIQTTGSDYLYEYKNLGNLLA